MHQIPDKHVISIIKNSPSYKT